MEGHLMSIHPTAIIDEQATIADGVTIGPYVVIEGPVKLVQAPRFRRLP